MLQHIVLNLGVGCPILKFGHIHIFQRELNPNLFRVDITLGKQDNRLNMARLLQIDVECVAKFAFVRGNLSKSVFAVKHTDFYPLYVLGNRSKTLLLLIICKRTDSPTASRLCSDGTSPKSHRLNSKR